MKLGKLIFIMNMFAVVFSLVGLLRSHINNDINGLLFNGFVGIINMLMAMTYKGEESISQ